MIKIEFDEAAPQTTTCDFGVTESAKKKLKSVFSDKEGSFLRLTVTSGGCNGFNYTFDIDNDMKSNDLSMEVDDITIIIDAESNKYVTGSTIDFVQELQASHFKLVNPQATSSCSCGTSFSI